MLLVFPAESAFGWVGWVGGSFLFGGFFVVVFDAEVLDGGVVSVGVESAGEFFADGDGAVPACVAGDGDVLGLVGEDVFHFGAEEVLGFWLVEYPAAGCGVGAVAWAEFGDVVGVGEGGGVDVVSASWGVFWAGGDVHGPVVLLCVWGLCSGLGQSSVSASSRLWPC